jgi:ATP-dependent Clp protease ATP-binding subunit ClpA
LSRRFQKIEIPEPSVEDTYLILSGIRDKYEGFHSVKYTDKALQCAAELSAKYINDRHLPDKAIDLIDEAGAYARLHADSDEEITIHEKDIERIISQIAKIPEKSVSSNEINQLRYLDISLKKEIFGQDKAIDTVVRAIKRSRAGFNESEKPVSSLLFVGPTGVGKTEISKQLSKFLGIPLIALIWRIPGKTTVARLIGAPPDIVADEGGLLTDAIRKTPYCVLLLEGEKAHPDIYNILLQIMDYATLTDNTGRRSISECHTIMTSNAGAKDGAKRL